MRICYWGTYDRTHFRNHNMITGLAQTDIELVECHAPLWRHRDERVKQASEQASLLKLGLRLVSAYVRLTLAFLVTKRPDVVIVGYPGQIDALLARLLCSLRRVPLVLDAFLSLYETAVIDRGLVPAQSGRAKWLQRIERWACQHADLVLMDTKANCDYVQRLYGINNCAPIWVGAQEPDADDALLSTTQQKQHFDVLWVGTFIPLHGVEHILHAASLLEDIAPEIIITLVGAGQTRAEMRRLANELKLSNLRWGPVWLNPPELERRILQADVMLGIFGVSAKAQRVIPGKAYLAIALARPLITADTPGMREAFSHGKTALLCPPGDAAALAEAIQALYRDASLREHLASRGHLLYRERFTPRAIGEMTLQTLSQFLQPTSQHASGS